MIEILYVLIGIIVGVSCVLGIQWIYRWIDNLRREIDILQDRYQKYSYQTELWTEFNFWKRSQQKEQ